MFEYLAPFSSFRVYKKGYCTLVLEEFLFYQLRSLRLDLVKNLCSTADIFNDIATAAPIKYIII